MTIKSAFVVMALTQIAVAGEVSWFDPALGCGRDFSVTGRAADLPGCSGKIPKDSPPVEVVLHDAKRALLDAEEALAKNKPDKMDALLSTAQAAFGRAPGMNPALPDRWDDALPQYQREVSGLKNRRKLVPHLDKLRAAYLAALDSYKTTDPARSQAASEACLAAFNAVSSDGIDLATEVDLKNQKQVHPLEAARAECDTGRKAAVTLIQTRVAAVKAKRAALRKKLRGDRLKIFDAHPDALPDSDGDPAKAVLWTYGAESVSFKGNKAQKH